VRLSPLTTNWIASLAMTSQLKVENGCRASPIHNHNLLYCVIPSGADFPDTGAKVK
jgi:hypothetical protein